jgi:hypothetical protein
MTNFKNCSEIESSTFGVAVSVDNHCNIQVARSMVAPRVILSDHCSMVLTFTDHGIEPTQVSKMKNIKPLVGDHKFWLIFHGWSVNLLLCHRKVSEELKL